MLLLEERLGGDGMVRYTYSIGPGVTVTLCTRPGPAMSPADDPAILSIVADLARRANGYTTLE